jgi:DNA-directed RNA polymerase specialized sigma24 family protein
LNDLMNYLSDDDRTLLTMIYHDDASYDDVATALGISYPAARQRHFRLKCYLRSQLQAA